MKYREKRIERKWTYNNVNNLILYNALLRSNFFFSVHYPKRKINSLYFDDLNYSSINENLDGVSEKKNIVLDGMVQKTNLIIQYLKLNPKKTMKASRDLLI